MAAPRVDRKRLEIALSRIPDHPDPKSRFEQVRTPGAIATKLLLAATEAGDIVGKRVADLGCGTGVFTVGAALLGATRVVGVDIDGHAMAFAQEAAEREDVADRVVFEQGDILLVPPARLTELAAGPVDTVVMNPPFGADLGSRARGGDRVFLALAFRTAPVVLSLHPAHTERFLVAFARDAGFDVAKLEDVAFPLVARFAHHRDEVRALPVGLYRFTRVARP